jgi:glyoxylase-like metal-dependent hydrolase (beta-lactamase superfamily II)
VERADRVTTPPASDRSWEEPGAFPVSPGVFRIPLPLPGDGLRAVNVYALESDGGVTLVDAGMSRTASWDALGTGLRQAGAELGDVRRVLVTHIHRDHFGQACAVRRASGATVLLGSGEQRSLEYILDDTQGDRRAPWIARLRRSGAAELIAELGRAEGANQSLRQDEGLWELPDDWAGDGEVIEVGERSLVAIETPGHTRGHLAFMDPTSRLLFAGDHVLPHITPSIGFEPPLVDGLPLADFLASLIKVRDLAIDTVLPAHGAPFTGLAARVDELLAHHATRLAACRAVLGAGPRTAFEVARELAWTRRDRPYDDLDVFNRQLAVAETAAHLDLLASRGSVRVETRDGVRHYGVAG